MRIAIIANGFAESSIVLAKYLAQTGVSVDYYKVFGWGKDGKEPALEFDKVGRFFLYHKEVDLNDVPEIKSYFKDLPFSFHLIRHSEAYKRVPFLYDFAIKRLARLIRQKKYDAINIVGGKDTVIFHQILAKEPIFHSVHEVGDHFTEKKSSPEIDSIIRNNIPVQFFSESTRKRFLQIEGAEKCITTVIPFGKFETMLLYDKGKKINTTLDLNRPTFLYWGHIRPYKGLDVLYETVKLLKDSSHLFNIIIAGEGKDPYIILFRQLNNCIVINNKLSNQDINSLNKLATAIIMPYKSASQTGIAPTVFMFGKPIIASNVGALPEVVLHKKNGLMVEANNPQQLADAIMYMIKNPDIVKKLSEGAKKFGCGDKYDWNIISIQVITFIKQLTKARVNCL